MTAAAAVSDRTNLPSQRSLATSAFTCIANSLANSLKHSEKRSTDLAGGKIKKQKQYNLSEKLLLRKERIEFIPAQKQNSAFHLDYFRSKYTVLVNKQKKRLSNKVAIKEIETPKMYGGQGGTQHQAYPSTVHTSVSATNGYTPGWSFNNNSSSTPVSIPSKLVGPVRSDDRLHSQSLPVTTNVRFVSVNNSPKPVHKFEKPLKQLEKPKADEGIPIPKRILYNGNITLDWAGCPMIRIGAGLMNLGNTCFLNSTLQCLTYTASLAQYILSGGHNKCQINGSFCMICEFGKNLQLVRRPGQPVRPEGIIRRLKLIAKNMTFGRQEDAHEFLRYVIDAMQRSCLYGTEKSLDPASKNTTLINQIFGGYFRSQVKCMRCEHKSNTYDPNMDLCLDIKNVNELRHALQRYIQVENLHHDNAYHCPNCSPKHGLQPASKCMTIAKAPRVLTVQLKRFDFQRVFGSKVTKHVSFPEKLNIRPYMSQPSGSPVFYELYAVLVHEGMTCNSGHYYSYVRAPNRTWYLMNDSRVSSVSLSEVHQSYAYILFYQKLESSPPLTNSNKTFTTWAEGDSSGSGSKNSNASGSDCFDNQSTNSKMINGRSNSSPSLHLPQSKLALSEPAKEISLGDQNGFSNGDYETTHNPGIPQGNSTHNPNGYFPNPYNASLGAPPPPPPGLIRGPPPPYSDTMPQTMGGRPSFMMNSNIHQPPPPPPPPKTGLLPTPQQMINQRPLLQPTFSNPDLNSDPYSGKKQQIPGLHKTATTLNVSDQNRGLVRTDLYQSDGAPKVVKEVRKDEKKTTPRADPDSLQLYPTEAAFSVDKQLVSSVDTISKSKDTKTGLDLSSESKQLRNAPFAPRSVTVKEKPLISQFSKPMVAVKPVQQEPQPKQDESAEHDAEIEANIKAAFEKLQNRGISGLSTQRSVSELSQADRAAAPVKIPIVRMTAENIQKWEAKKAIEKEERERKRREREERRAEEDRRDRERSERRKRLREERHREEEERRARERRREAEREKEREDIRRRNIERRNREREEYEARKKLERAAEADARRKRHRRRSSSSSSSRASDAPVERKNHDEPDDYLAKMGAAQDLRKARRTDAELKDKRLSSPELVKLPETSARAAFPKKEATDNPVSSINCPSSVSPPSKKQLKPSLITKSDSSEEENKLVERSNVSTRYSRKNVSTGENPKITKDSLMNAQSVDEANRLKSPSLSSDVSTPPPRQVSRNLKKKITKRKSSDSDRSSVCSAPKQKRQSSPVLTDSSISSMEEEPLKKKLDKTSEKDLQEVLKKPWDKKLKKKHDKSATLKNKNLTQQLKETASDVSSIDDGSEKSYDSAQLKALKKERHRVKIELKRRKKFMAAKSNVSAANKKALEKAKHKMISRRSSSPESPKQLAIVDDEEKLPHFTANLQADSVSDNNDVLLLGKVQSEAIQESSSETSDNEKRIRKKIKKVIKKEKRKKVKHNKETKHKDLSKQKEKHKDSKHRKHLLSDKCETSPEKPAKGELKSDRKRAIDDTQASEAKRAKIEPASGQAVDVVAELERMSTVRGLGASVTQWDGEKPVINRQVERERAKEKSDKWADRYEAELDGGKKKKKKKKHRRSGADSGVNLFQRAQDMTNRADGLVSAKRKKHASSSDSS